MRQNSQELYEFAMIEIFASYFSGEKIRSQRVNALWLYFAESDAGKQYKAEDDCERYLLSHFIPNLSPSFLSHPVIISALYEPDKGKSCLVFEAGHARISMYIIPPRRGEKLVVWHKVSRV